MSEYCKYCGQEYRDARSLLMNSCMKAPVRGGKHALFEGDRDGSDLRRQAQPGAVRSISLKGQ